jgi:hypothetical protein
MRVKTGRFGRPSIRMASKAVQTSKGTSTQKDHVKADRGLRRVGYEKRNQPKWGWFLLKGVKSNSSHVHKASIDTAWFLPKQTCPDRKYNYSVLLSIFWYFNSWSVSRLTWKVQIFWPEKHSLSIEPYNHFILLTNFRFKLLNLWWVLGVPSMVPCRNYLKISLILSVASASLALMTPSIIFFSFFFIFLSLRPKGSPYGPLYMDIPWSFFSGGRFSRSAHIFFRSLETIGGE